MKQQAHCDDDNEAPTGHLDSLCTQPTRWRHVQFDAGLKQNDYMLPNKLISRIVEKIEKQCRLLLKYFLCGHIKIQAIQTFSLIFSSWGYKIQHCIEDDISNFLHYTYFNDLTD
jgi:hypothetical protein